MNEHDSNRGISRRGLFKSAVAAGGAWAAIGLVAPPSRAAQEPSLKPGSVVLFQGDSITDAGRDRRQESPKARCGGLTSNREQIETVVRHGRMWLGSGLTDPDISLAAALILYAAFGLEKPAALNGPQFLTASVLKRPLEIEGGRARVPAGPGLGIEVDEDKVRDLVSRSAAGG